MLPILGNGPPGTFVLFPDGLRMSLPTDQVVFAVDSGGGACFGFGGMHFTGMADGPLVFVRARELFPEEQLSPVRSHTMRLDRRSAGTFHSDRKRSVRRQASAAASPSAVSSLAVGSAGSSP